MLRASSRIIPQQRARIGGGEVQFQGAERWVNFWPITVLLQAPPSERERGRSLRSHCYKLQDRNRLLRFDYVDPCY